MEGLARAIPALKQESDVVRLDIEGDRIAVGNYSLPCVWQSAGGHTIHLPADAPLSMVVRLSWERSEEEIEQSGLTGVVDAAVERMDKIVERAAKALGPFEITEDDVREFVRRSVQDGGGPVAR